MSEHASAAPSDTFEAASEVSERARDGARVRFDARMPDGWHQGAGAFGGLVLGTLARAMERAHGDPTRRLRSLQGEVLAPVKPGALAIDVELLRVGKGMTFVDARMQADGAVVARASAAFGAPRPQPVPVPVVAPAHVDASQLEVVELAPPTAPEFTPHYAYQMLPPFPFSGAEARLEGFVRARRPPARLDAAHVIGLLDAWMPAYFGVLDAPRALSTVSFMAELIADPATLDPGAALRHRGLVVAAADGYTLEQRELWAGDTLVALNQQTFAIVR